MRQDRQGPGLPPEPGGRRQNEPAAQSATAAHPSLILGTAPFGQPYGLGQAGQGEGLSLDDIHHLLDHAHAGGILALDTARGYGRSEQIIGAWMAKSRKYFNIFSKCSKLGDLPDDIAARQVDEDIDLSLKQLGVHRLAVVLAHHPVDILRPVVSDALREQQRRGRIAGFGVSVYTVDEADQAIDIEGISSLQVPISILNQAFLGSSILARAQQAGVQIYARSVYTQGLVFLDPAELPMDLPVTAARLRTLRRLADETGHDLSTLALAPLVGRADIAGLVVGCDSAAQLDSLVSAVTTRRPAPEIVQRVLDACAGIPAHETDPRLWRRHR